MTFVADRQLQRENRRHLSDKKHLKVPVNEVSLTWDAAQRTDRTFIEDEQNQIQSQELCACALKPQTDGAKETKK